MWKCFKSVQYSGIFHMDDEEQWRNINSHISKTTTKFCMTSVFVSSFSATHWFSVLWLFLGAKSDILLFTISHTGQWCCTVCAYCTWRTWGWSHTRTQWWVTVCFRWICQNACMTSTLYLCSCCDRSFSISHKYNRPNLNCGEPQWKANIKQAAKGESFLLKYTESSFRLHWGWTWWILSD